MSLEERDDKLNQKMAEHPIEESVQVLIKDANRRRLQLAIVSIVVVLNIILTGGLVVALSGVQQNTEALKANCETANDSRKSQRTLWSYVLSTPPDKPRTAEQNKRVEDFRKFVDKTFASRNCQDEINT